MSTATSSTSSTSSTSASYSNGRYWGLATGLDVDSIVTAMVSDYQTKIDKANQNKQILQWKSDAYTSIVSKIKAFESAYLDITSSSGCMLSDSTFNNYTASVDNAAVSVTANADAQPGSSSIIIYKSATTGAVRGASFASPVKGTLTSTDANTLKSSLTGKSFTVTADGVSQVISFAAGDDYSDMQTLLNNKLSSAFGTDSSGNCKVKATVDGSGNVSIDANTAAGYASQITVTSGLAVTDITKGATSALTTLGISEYGATNRVGSGTTVSALFGSNVSSLGADANGNFGITVNGKSISLNTSDSLSSVTSKIAASGANVTLSYDKAAGVFTLKSTASGSGSGITLGTDSASSAFFSGLLGNASSRTVTAGQDAVFSLDGGSTKMTRSSNTFTVNGVSYTINSPISSATTANVTLTSDTSTTKTAITKFIDAYNDLLDAVNTQISTKPDTTSQYLPLTDTQKKSMTDDEISAWNVKAQQGLLLNDNTLSKVAYSLRSVMYQTVTTSSGQSIALYDLGIGTSFDSDGKLSITDSSKLQTMLQQSPDMVTELFTKSSSILYSTGDATQAQRRQQEGLGARIKDVLDDAISSTGSTKGSLITLIGSSSDTGNYHSSIYQQIVDLNTSVKTLSEQMAEKKDQLYSKFTQLEVYMEKMNAQTSAISSFGGSSS